MSFNYTVQLEVFTDVCKSKHSIINVNKRNKQNITAAAKSICACMQQENKIYLQNELVTIVSSHQVLRADLYNRFCCNSTD